MGPGKSRDKQDKGRCEESDQQDADHGNLEALLDRDAYQKKHRFKETYTLPKLQDDELRLSDLHYSRTRRVSVRAWPETTCSVDYETGEICCEHRNAVPRKDCRQPWCFHRKEMLERTRRRLKTLGFAPGQRLNGAVLFLRRGSEEETDSNSIESISHAKRMRIVKAQLRWEQEDS